MPVVMDGFHQQVDEFFAVDVCSLGGVVNSYSVSQRRAGDCLDIAGGGVMATVQDGSGFCAADQRQHSARSGAPACPFIDDVWSFF